MKFTLEQLESLKNDEGHFSSKEVEHIEALTGKAFADVVAEAQEAAPGEPEGDPKTWSTNKKIDYVSEHGQEKWKQLLQR